jgi:hypothetical protein
LTICDQTNSNSQKGIVPEKKKANANSLVPNAVLIADSLTAAINLP